MREQLEIATGRRILERPEPHFKGKETQAHDDRERAIIIQKRFGIALNNKLTHISMSREEFGSIIGLSGEEMQQVLDGRKPLKLFEYVRIMKLLLIKPDCLFDECEIDYEEAMLQNLVKKKSAVVDSEIAEMERKLRELQDKKNVISRISGVTK